MGSNKALSLIAILASATALYFGRGFFIPVALAVFFHAMLRPLIRRLELFGMPTPIAATVMLFALLAVGGAGVAVISGPAKTWMVNAPAMFTKAEMKLQQWLAPVKRVTDAAQELSQSAGNTGQAVPRPATPATPAPQFLQDLFGTTATLIAGSIEVLLMLFLLMSSGGIFLKRLVSLLPARADKRTAVAVSEEVEAAVSGYLFATLLMNMGEAVLVGLSLWALGMPDPLLWGLMTLALEFIPYIGGALLVALLSISAVAQFDSIGHAVIMPLTYLVISAVQNYVVSPIFYGNRLKLNPVAVLLSVFFLWSLWGAFGAFLAVPILAATKILCDHIESMGPLGKFLEA